MNCLGRFWSCCGAALAGLMAVGSPCEARAAGVESPVPKANAPRLFPDYAGIVIPPNIAPLNFKVEEPGTRYRVEFRSISGPPVVVSSRTPSIRIPVKPWRALLRSNAGHPLYCEVSVQDRQNQWSRFATVTNFVARDEIDPYLAYRLLKPLYNVYVNLGIYQRDLQSFAERPVLQNQKFGGDCLNCHTFLNRRPETFAFHVRTYTKVNPMVLVCSNEVTRVDKPMGYLSWHPSGRLLAFSANKLSMFFHAIGETRDVFDATSNLGIYRVDSNIVVNPAPIALTNRNETWPAWSPDGRHLYYCSAPPLRVERFRQVRYDLMRVSYDLERNQWGEPEVLVAARDTGLSANQPKVSPDGRFVLFCLCQYGNFPIYQPSSDLYLLDLKTRRHHRLDINSDQADSWHSWSGNSRWVVFSSKRVDGLFARPFFSYVDEQGQFHKPFLLPQEDPAFYDTFLKTYNVPELVAGPVTVTQNALAQAIVKPLKALTPQAETPPASQPSQTDQGADQRESTYHQIPR
jgi:hypothetical protein